jgi:hypothetical protein
MISNLRYVTILGLGEAGGEIARSVCSTGLAAAAAEMLRALRLEPIMADATRAWLSRLARRRVTAAPAPP